MLADTFTHTQTHTNIDIQIVFKKNISFIFKDFTFQRSNAFYAPKLVITHEISHQNSEQNNQKTQYLKWLSSLQIPADILR